MVTSNDTKRIRDLIKVVDGFPLPGIPFKDLTPVLQDWPAYSSIIEWMSQVINDSIDSGRIVVAGIEARGFIFAAALAHYNGLPLVLIRKPGKLPRPTYSVAAPKEYGEEVLHLQIGDVQPGDFVFIVDDVLATGGTALAAIQLVKMSGGIPQVMCVVELPYLGGRSKLMTDALVHTLVSFEKP